MAWVNPYYLCSILAVLNAYLCFYQIRMDAKHKRELAELTEYSKGKLKELAHYRVERSMRK